MWNDSTAGLGGGFLDDSTQAGENTGKKSSYTSITYVPVFIKHITFATGDLQNAGKTVKILTFVGVVRRVEQNTTKISVFSIQDDTDTVTAVLCSENKNLAETTVAQLNTYVRVYGEVRQSNQRHVLIRHMYPVEDLNELTCHFMEVMYLILSAKSEKESDVSSTSNILMSDSTMSGMSPDQAAILEIVRSANESECGIENRDILAQIPKHIVPHADEILDFLLYEGHIYTTSSEDFFKAT